MGMPKVILCPRCGKRMKRLYAKMGDKSSPYGMGWKCPEHIWINGYDPNSGEILMRYDSVPFSIIKNEL